MIDIVIVNWNSGAYLKKCLQSVFITSPQEIIQRVYIIDNHSADQSLDNLPENGKLEVVKNTENAGFSRACNQGFRLCSAPFVLLLNPDTLLLPSTLDDCLNFMNRHREMDILGCQLLGDNGEIAKTCARFPTPLRMCYDAIGLSKIAPRIFTPATLMTDWNHTESRVVDQVMGAFMFMRKSVFEKAGYFDERFFVYYEELDFSKRLAAGGGLSYFHAQIQAVHSGEGTTNAVKGFRLFLNLRSRLQYAKKHFNITAYALVWFCTFFIEPVSRIFLLLFSGRAKQVRDVFKGYRLLYSSLPIR